VLFALRLIQKLSFQKKAAQLEKPKEFAVFVK
jgi:hypothetical protein